MGKARRALLIGAGLLGAGVWIASAGRRSIPTEQLDLVTVELELAIRDASASARARALTLAQLPRLGWAVATDEVTVRDLTAEELAFRPRPGEQIEISQVHRPSGKIQRLIVIPTGARPLAPAPEPGVSVDVNGDQVRVIAVVTVQPRQRVETVGGLLAVARELNLAAVGARLDAANVAARLEAATGSTMLGTAQPSRGARAVEVPLQSPAAHGARLLLSVPTGLAWGQIAGALALLATTIVSAFVVGRRNASGNDDSAAPAALEGSRRRASAPSSPAPSMRPLEVSGPIVTREAARTTIASALFATGAGPPPPPHRDDDPQVIEYRALFGEFVKLRRTCGESTDDLSRDRFVEALLGKAAEVGGGGTSGVRFQLVFDNGKAAVRYKRV